MSSGTRRPRGRVAAVVVFGLIAGVTAAGCGDDDEDGGGDAPATLEITATEDGTETTLEAPESAEAGLTEITLTNEGERPHSGQLLRIEGEHTEDEVLAGFEAASSGKPFPEWFFAGGGTGTAGPGESRTVTQELEPDSTYWLVDDEAPGKPPITEIEITGEGSDEALEETGNVVTAVDFSFEAEGLTSGEEITFKNEGEQPHHMIAAPITGDATIEEVETFFKEEKGQPPVDFENGRFTSVLEGGTEQATGLTLDPGRWALVCFISSREGGPPHVALGMIDEVEVAE